MVKAMTYGVLLAAVLWTASAPAAGMAVRASSVHPGDYPAAAAFDTDTHTRWASAAGTGHPEWLDIDLGESLSFESVSINWEAAFATAYEIRVSDDGRTFKTVVRRQGFAGGVDRIATPGARGRWVRIWCVKPNGFNLYSIWEVDVTGGQAEPAIQAWRRTAAERAQRERVARLKAISAQLGASGVKEIVFAVRGVIPEHWYANFGYYAAKSGKSYFGTTRLYRDGARLCSLSLADGSVRTILADEKGGIRDPQVHYSGRKMLFSYRPGGTLNYHLYEINTDGSGLRQLTDGPFDDIEPSYFPDGGIVFVSSRAKRWVNCWLSQVATLHRCDADGSHIREISSNNEHDNTPWPLPDGRILYTRWEYVDRSQVHYHHLWAADPDGTVQSVYFGNQHPGTVFIDAKPIPGRVDRVVASFSPGHGQTEHAGQIGIIDTSMGPDAAADAREITREADYRDPWAFSDQLFMAARGDSICLVDDKGVAMELYRLRAEDRAKGMQCHEPRPLLGHAPETIIPARADLKQDEGRMVLANVYEGRNMAGVKRGEIKQLLVLETLPKPINFTGGMEPLSYGGTFTLERILGTVPVEPDGSAYFRVPALRSVFFVALDEKDMSVKRMQSFATVQPGETLGCVGCHEHRTASAPVSSGRLQAMERAPSRIEPITDVPDVMDFPRDIQPILDRHCVQCHDAGKRDGGVILSGDRGPIYSLSYFNLFARSQVADGRNRPVSSYPPRKIGSSASPLMAKLDPAHYGVKVSALEKKFVRLWIDSGAPYPGTYAALGCGMVGGYAQNNLDRCDLAWASTKAAAQAMQRRCCGCHTGDRSLPMTVTDILGRHPWEDMSPDDPRRKYARHLLYNLSHPEKSVLLLAPLSKSAGGYGLCGEKGFASTADKDYQLILAAITDAKKKLDEIRRFDMPGFHPRVEWVREMKRFGILPNDAPWDAAYDTYAIERKYWKSLWYRPDASTPQAARQ